MSTKHDLTMLNIHPFIKGSDFFKKLEIDDLLFVEYKCLVEEVKFGIWSDVNYFVFVTSGRKIWRTIYNEYDVKAGDSLFVKKGANLAHQYFEEDYCALMVFISDDFIKKFMARFANVVHTGSKQLSKSDAVIRVGMDAYLGAYVHSMASFFGPSVNPDKNLLKLKFEELLLNVFTSSAHKELAQYLTTLNKDQVAQLTQVMEENFAYNLKLEDFAELCGVSLSSFKRLFKSTYNISPGKWLSEKRMDLAVNLLKNTDKNINQISFEIGFEETSSFIRVFKQKFENTPLQYRENIG